MKLLLVAINSKFSHTNIAVHYLKKYLDDNAKNVETKIYQSNINSPRKEVLASLLKEDFDVIGFSLYIFNRTFIEGLASDLKKLKKCKIIIGGAEASGLCGELFDLADHIIYGDGEKALLSLVDSNFTLDKQIVGIRLTDSEIPRLSTCGYFDCEKQKIKYFESTRGCPFSCSFCSSANMNLVQIPLQVVFSELDAISSKNLRQVKFVDRTFNADKKRAAEILSYIVGLNTATNFHMEIAADLVDDEFVNIVKDSKCGQFQFEIGIQSFNDEVLTLINRKFDTKKLVENISKLIDAAKAHIHIDLICGLPNEDFASVKNSFNLAYSLQADALQLGFLKLLKGTPLYKERLKYKIEASNYPPYEVLSTSTLSFFELLELKFVEKSLDLFYNDRNFKATLNYLVKFTPSPFDLFYFIGKYIGEKNLSDKPLSLFKKIELLYNYCEGAFTNAEQINFTKATNCDFFGEVEGALSANYTRNAIKERINSASSENTCGDFKASENAFNLELFSELLRFDFLCQNSDGVFKPPLKNTKVRGLDSVYSFTYNPLTHEKTNVNIHFDYSSFNEVKGTYLFKIVNSVV